MPDSRPAECLGEQCSDFTGAPCDSYEVWFAAADEQNRRYYKRPPLQDKAQWIAYGQVCTRGAAQSYMATRIEIYGFGGMGYKEARDIIEKPDIPYEVRIIGEVATVVLRGRGTSEADGGPDTV